MNIDVQKIVILALIVFIIIKACSTGSSNPCEIDGEVYYSSGENIHKRDDIKLMHFEKSIKKGDRICYKTEDMIEEQCGSIKDAGAISDDEFIISIEGDDGTELSVITH